MFRMLFSASMPEPATVANGIPDRQVLSGRPVAFVLGNGVVAERDRDAALELPRESVATTSIPSDDPIQEQIDTELRRKYARANSTSVEAMLSPRARACTLRIEDPATT